MRHKWFQIGIQLGIPHHILRQFSNENDPLSAALDYWLKGNVVESNLWKSIVAALESTFVDEPLFANEISRKYCQDEEGYDI